MVVWSECEWFRIGSMVRNNDIGAVKCVIIDLHYESLHYG